MAKKARRLLLAGTTHDPGDDRLLLAGLNGFLAFTLTFGVKAKKFV
jgi:hypothetical protein